MWAVHVHVCACVNSSETLNPKRSACLVPARGPPGRGLHISHGTPPGEDFLM